MKPEGPSFRRPSALSFFKQSSRNLGSSQEQFFAAAKKGDVVVAEKLLKEGTIDLEAFDNSSTALHIATSAGKDKMVEFLLNNGAKVDTLTQDLDPLAVLSLGQTALELAFTSGNPKIIKLLVEKGASLERSTDGENNPLTAIALLRLHAPAKSISDYKAATVAILDRMEPESILKSLEYLIKEKPKAAAFLVNVIRDYAKSGVVHQDQETLLKSFTEKFDHNQQERFNKIANQFKAEKILGPGDKQQKSAAVVDERSESPALTNSPSTTPDKVTCFSFLSSLFRGGRS